MLTMIWLILGYNLSFHKAQKGFSVNWVGYTITTMEEKVRAQIKYSFLKDLATATKEILSKNVIGRRKLRKYTGSANHVSNLLFAWRPFLDSLWAASAAGPKEQMAGKAAWRSKHRKTRAPKGTVWTKQIKGSLRWILDFLSGVHGPLTREWLLHHYVDTYTTLRMVLDASPWGLGGVLFENDVPISYFTSRLTKDDVKLHRRPIGDSDGQQVWESLVVLVALRAWKDVWLPRRLSVTIRGDNVSALYMAAQMKSKASPLVNKELALLYTKAAFLPRHVEHIPGLTNGLADELSRIWEPGAGYKIPDALKHVPPVPIPIRNRKYYEVLTAKHVG